MRVLDKDFNILRVNDIFSTLSGVSRDEAIGKKCYEVFRGPMCFTPDCPLTRILAGEKRVEYEVEKERKDGTRVPCIVTGTPFQGHDGKLIGIVEDFKDITTHKQAEKALRESEGKLNAMLQSIGDPIIMMDKDLNIIWSNEIAKKTFGEDIIGEKCNEIFNKMKEPLEPYPCLTLEAFKDGKGHDREIKVIDKDGETIYFHCTANVALRDKDGSPSAVIEIFRNITEHKRLKEQLLQAQKMEAVGQLAGGIAHDFNNILTAIIGYGTLLNTEMGKDDPLKNYVKQILSSSERAVKLIQALLAFSRKQIINLRPINLNGIIIALEKLLSRIIGEDIELSTVLADEDLTVIADSTQIEQVLMNLATNARDAMPDGGSLIIRTESVTFDYEYIKTHGYGMPGPYVLLSVEDTGVGMAKDQRERIFEPFYTTKEVGKGTGLGLSIVYGIIKQHNGYINVYSESGKGTTFKIYLPLIKSKVEEEKSADLSIIKRGTETILVAEDDA
ncbi:MAG: PAS domain-containing protein, partial [Nitrospirota bacterium]